MQNYVLCVSEGKVINQLGNRSSGIRKTQTKFIFHSPTNELFIVHISCSSRTIYDVFVCALPNLFLPSPFAFLLALLQLIIHLFISAFACENANENSSVALLCFTIGFKCCIPNIAIYLSCCGDWLDDAACRHSRSDLPFLPAALLIAFPRGFPPTECRS